MKLPEDVRRLLVRHFRGRHREWLCGGIGNSWWPLEISLGLPTESAAQQQVAGVRAWVAAWQGWQGPGTLAWCERRFRALGVQRLPDRLVLQGPDEVATWIGESARWERARSRYEAMTARWPALQPRLSRHFDVLADYADVDFGRLAKLLDWIGSHPDSGLYPRQLPIAGLDSKWLERRKGLVTDLVAAIQEGVSGDLGFHERCGLRAQPMLVRIRVLDRVLRDRVAGLGDLSIPEGDLAGLELPASHVFIVENLQTGLAMADVPGAVVVMGLGYRVDVLGRVPWIVRAQATYWGDLDTHGFAILNRARSHLPSLASVLMDEDTLLRHRTLWVEEQEQHPATELALLDAAENAVYRGLKQQRWGQNVRLEQERIVWDAAWGTLLRRIECS